MTNLHPPDSCPDCGEPLAGRGLVLARREDDGRRVCRAVFKCRSGHRWWRWVDRSGPLELVPDYLKLT